MHKETKAKTISPSVKMAVRARDCGCCVICHSPAEPIAHYISRAQGGLGIEENIVCLCNECHRRYDQSADRDWIRKSLKKYLSQHYPYWDEKDLVYRKDR